MNPLAIATQGLLATPTLISVQGLLPYTAGGSTGTHPPVAIYTMGRMMGRR